MFATRRPLACCLVIATLAAATSAIPAFAADGDLDSTFDGDGMVSVQVSTGHDDWTEDLLVLPDGGILLAGWMEHSATDSDFAVVKLRRNGTLDTSFGNGGSRTIAFDLGGGWADVGTAIAMQADGKLVVAGYAETAQVGDYDLAATRLNADGSIDWGFGSAGRVTVPIDLGGNNFDVASDVLIQPDGRVVLTGWADRPGFGIDFVAVRLLASGALDTTFGVQGIATVAFDLGGNRRDESNAAVLQSDGKIVLVGSAEWNNNDHDFAAARLLPNGSLDPSFGTGGKRTVAFDRGGANQDYAESVIVDGSGRLVLAGRSQGSTWSGHDFAVARLRSDGNLDPTFSSDGKVTVGIDQGLGVDQANAVAIAPLGKLVVVGVAFLSTTNVDYAVVRLNGDGSLDSSFGVNGRARVAFDIGGDLRDKVRAVGIGIDGGIVVAGTVDTHWGQTLTGVARLEGTPWLTVAP